MSSPYYGYGGSMGSQPNAFNPGVATQGSYSPYSYGFNPMQGGFNPYQNSYAQYGMGTGYNPYQYGFNPYNFSGGLQQQGGYSPYQMGSNPYNFSPMDGNPYMPSMPYTQSSTVPMDGLMPIGQIGSSPAPASPSITPFTPVGGSFKSPTVEPPISANESFRNRMTNVDKSGWEGTLKKGQNGTVFYTTAGLGKPESTKTPKVKLPENVVKSNQREML